LPWKTPDIRETAHATFGPLDPPSEIPNNRHVSNWDRWHGGAGPQREQYTHQPRYVQLPAMPKPIGPARSHEVLQTAHAAPQLPPEAYQGQNDLGTHHHGGVAQASHACECCGPKKPFRYQAGGYPGYEGASCDPMSNAACYDPTLGGCIRMPDEYICDGGDRDVRVDVLKDWTVRGLDTEDTIAHYDTLQGETHVEASNRVCIYAPRFAAVRTVSGIIAHEQSTMLLAARDRDTPYLHQEDALVTTAIQQQQLHGKFGLKPVNIYEGADVGLPLQMTHIPAGMTVGFLPHEDFKLIRTGIADLAEKPRLSNAIQNAIAWSHDAAVQVSIDGKIPVEASNNVALEQVYRYDFGESRLRIIKTASKQNAKPGEIVDFTLRFDNIGDQTVGNVTIMDNLTTRLEYVDGSVQSSVAADFFTEENNAQSLVLRFEVVEPVKVGQGGVIRFQARVR
jgi:uncharacterized repeat protein (TIGR01451 family)